MSDYTAIISAKSRTLLTKFYKVPNQIFYSNQVLLSYILLICVEG